MTDRSSENGTANSRAALARAMGVHPCSVTRWIRRGDWPFPTAPPWNVSEVREWRSGLQGQEAGGTGTEARGLDLRIKCARLRLLEARTADATGETVPRAFHEQCLRGIADVCVKAFEELPAAVSREIAGLTPAEIEQVLTDRIDDIRRRVAGEAAAQQARVNARPRNRRVGRPLRDDQR